MNWITKKRALTTLFAVFALAIAGAAYAYFTSTGSGTGTASVGTSSSLTLHGTVTSTLYPGTSSPVTFTVDNPSSGSERVGTISLASVTADAEHSGCKVSAFKMSPVTVNQVFGHGNGQEVHATGTLSMENTEENQDACQGAELTLHLSSE